MRKVRAWVYCLDNYGSASNRVCGPTPVSRTVPSAYLVRSESTRLYLCLYRRTLGLPEPNSVRILGSAWAYLTPAGRALLPCRSPRRGRLEAHGRGSSPRLQPGFPARPGALGPRGRGLRPGLCGEGWGGEGAGRGRSRKGRWPLRPLPPGPALPRPPGFRVMVPSAAHPPRIKAPPALPPGLGPMEMPPAAAGARQGEARATGMGRQCGLRGRAEERMGRALAGTDLSGRDVGPVGSGLPYPQDPPNLVQVRGSWG